MLYPCRDLLDYVMHRWAQPGEKRYVLTRVLWSDIRDWGRGTGWPVADFREQRITDPLGYCQQSGAHSCVSQDALFATPTWRLAVPSHNQVQCGEGQCGEKYRIWWRLALPFGTPSSSPIRGSLLHLPVLGKEDSWQDFPSLTCVCLTMCFSSPVPYSVYLP